MHTDSVHSLLFNSTIIYQVKRTVHAKYSSRNCDLRNNWSRPSPWLHGAYVLGGKDSLQSLGWLLVCILSDLSVSCSRNTFFTRFLGHRILLLCSHYCGILSDAPHHPEPQSQAFRYSPPQLNIHVLMPHMCISSLHRCSAGQFFEPKGPLNTPT